MRLFVAIDLPDTVKDILLPMMSKIPGAKWVKRHQLHLTLRFIGEVETAQFQAIDAGLQAIQVEPFDLRLSGVGCFPPKGKPRVLWVGVEKQPKLMTLQHQIETMLNGLGFKPEDHRFSAHITLARLKVSPPPKIVAEFLAKHEQFQTETIPIQDFILFSSVLSTKGPTYTAEKVYPLKRD